jgi:hypothetical protein
MEDYGYPRPVSQAMGGAAGGSVGSVVTAYFKHIPLKPMMKNDLKGGGIGLALVAVQGGLE